MAPGTVLQLRVLCLLVEAKGALVSTEALASETNGDAAQLRNVIHQLRRDGWRITNLWGRGYRLDQDQGQTT
jgi:biotin operon repressor